MAQVNIEKLRQLIKAAEANNVGKPPVYRQIPQLPTPPKKTGGCGCGRKKS